MKVHLIAIGGSAMHNLAIALHKKGFKITGSDDEIVEPSKSRLLKHGLLPDEEGWYPEKITQDLNAVILGMHARVDNPELLKAKELGIKIYSYPEYIYEQSKDKIRVVIGGSHGKTSITAMILHVLSFHNLDADYLVGAQLTGFDTMVKLTKEAPIIIIEGDEYLASPIDRRPKFHLYKANLALLSGIAWDHINVFPTFENYIDQFRIFLQTISADGSLVYFSGDEDLKKLIQAEEQNLSLKTILPYSVHPHKIIENTTYLKTDEAEVPLEIFGEHNLTNLNGARLICQLLGITNGQFYQAISTFKGAARRLELIGKNQFCNVYKDFAHSPSKLKATTNAVKNQFMNRKLVACMELHTFSSLNKTFLEQYSGSMAAADEAIVYFNHHTIAHKKLPPITETEVKEAFGGHIKVFTDTQVLQNYLLNKNWVDTNLLLMSSGNFNGIDLDTFGQKLVGN